ncbi:MAG TPA: hemolysin III family protein [Thermoanaerobaculia bacterium]|nr:hemolysin III family protein [Thermoanaerobaculia bacterium]
MYEGERLNAITHLFGLVLALVGTAVLLAAAAPYEPRRTIALGIYGGMLVVLYLSSTLYHSVRGPAKKVFHVFDHCSIYLLIAGTYTPLTVVMMRGIWGWSIFAVVWSLALAGIVKDSVFHGRYRPASVVLYVLMGWTIVVAMTPLRRVLPPDGVAWLFAGGLIYTVGIVFFAMSRRVVHMHGIWHLFVVGGSAAHYVVVLRYVALAPA